MTSERKYILKANNAWRVKIRLGETFFNKQFHIDKYEDALSEAIKCRDQVLKQHGCLERLNFEKSPDYYSKKKVSPCIGVWLSQESSHWSWTARTPNDRKRHFSIEKYGYNEAFQMACKVRCKYCYRSGNSTGGCVANTPLFR